MTGVSYATSAEMAGELGAFPGYRQEPRGACCGSSATTAAPPTARAPATRACRSCRCRSTPTTAPTPRSWTPRTRAWDQALTLGELHGYRNAQATVIAPTGTIGLVMDCDTTGIEPDFALVKFKKLAGGGYFKIINRTVPDALAKLGYAAGEIDEIVRYAVGHGTLPRRPGVNHAALKAKGFTDRRARKRSRRALGTAFDIKFVFNKWTLGEEFCQAALGFPASSSTIRPSTCWPPSASRRRRSRPPTPTAAAR